jgi:hypothetical protein
VLSRAYLPVNQDLIVGRDRLIRSQKRSVGKPANAAAVMAPYGSPAVVVDFGTAVTFDVES